MPKLFLVGESPLPNQASANRTAAALRTWHFLKPLQKTKHQIVLLTVDGEYQTKKLKEVTSNKYFTHYILPRNASLVVQNIKKLLKRENFSAVIGINNYPAYLVAKANPKIPFWADLNGWLMSEAQAQAGITQNDSFLPFLWKREKKVLKKADRFSTVSLPQKYALYGELASIGRLNSQTHRYHLADVVPNSTELFTTDKISTKETFFRGKDIPKEAFVIAFIGGYNTWVDEKTLFHALENAMDQNSKIHFVSTGGAILGLNNQTFQNFFERIKLSRHKDRFHFLGWLKTEDMPRVYAESDCGINTDFLCIETETGARNRLNEMLKFGLPVITTRGSEVAITIEEYKLGLTAQNGNFEELSEHIIKLSKSTKLQKTLAQNGQKFIKQHWSYLKTITPLLEWLKNPQKSPNKIVKLNKKSNLRAGLLYLKQKGVRGFLKKLGL